MKLKKLSQKTEAIQLGTFFIAALIAGMIFIPKCSEKPWVLMIPTILIFYFFAKAFGKKIIEEF